ncbi:tRNA glutamyl-Q(34) synthetase GluQRS [Inmirania thermothiophila]|uniref:tRNA glutamyl-Q(34) synthetase GluQRS n=1 Tax=Inmirania thermothiophila TaxID=1750597 RepID=UPI000F4808DD
MNAGGRTPCGRFAPSPTGPLHFGSLVAALASFLEARSRRGRWLVRIEDLDRPRCVPGAADTILRQLEAFALPWEGPVLFQSRRIERYREVLAALAREGLLYPCACTRRELRAVARPGPAGPVYPGRCRGGLAPGRRPRALRVRVDGTAVDFVDAVRGPQREHLAATSGDFIVRRADGIVAYQLAVVVDDHDQGVTEVVRGADLLDSTARQIHLHRLLGLTPPRYAHVPVALGPDGAKLSKQTGARALDPAAAPRLLCAALRLLGQAPPPQLAGEPAATVVAWALAHWRLDRVPARDAPAPPEALP